MPEVGTRSRPREPPRATKTAVSSRSPTNNACVGLADRGPTATTPRGPRAPVPEPHEPLGRHHRRRLARPPPPPARPRRRQLLAALRGRPRVPGARPGRPVPVQAPRPAPRHRGRRVLRALDDAAGLARVGIVRDRQRRDVAPRDARPHREVPPDAAGAARGLRDRLHPARRPVLPARGAVDPGPARLEAEHRPGQDLHRRRRARPAAVRPAPPRARRPRPDHHRRPLPGPPERPRRKVPATRS